MKMVFTHFDDDETYSFLILEIENTIKFKTII